MWVTYVTGNCVLLFRNLAFRRSIKKYLFLELHLYNTTVIFLDAENIGFPKFAASLYKYLEGLFSDLFLTDKLLSKTTVVHVFKVWETQSRANESIKTFWFCLHGVFFAGWMEVLCLLLNWYRERQLGFSNFTVNNN